MKEINVKEKSKNIKGFFDDFKKFIKRGNVFDLAIGIIIGGAFSKIVSSLVDNILMPFIGLLIGGKDFTSYSFKIKDATINYGTFIQNVVDFIIVAFSIFILIKFMNKVFKKEEEKEKKEPPKKSDEVILLEEIRDLLKKNK